MRRRQSRDRGASVAARAAGDAAATAYVAGHAAHAATDALTAATDAATEREWQDRHLPTHLRPVAFPARGAT